MDFLGREEERKKLRGALVEGGSISGRISKCKQTMVIS